MSDLSTLMNLRDELNKKYNLNEFSDKNIDNNNELNLNEQRDVLSRNNNKEDNKLNKYEYDDVQVEKFISNEIKINKNEINEQDSIINKKLNKVQHNKSKKNLNISNDTQNEQQK